MNRRLAVVGAGAALGLALAVVAANVRAAGRVSADGEEEGDSALDAPLAALYGFGGDMKLSQAGRDAIARREGFSPTPYRDSAGFLTIGYGHLIAEGEAFQSITPADAGELLSADVAKAENAVSALVTVPLNQTQFDALVSFAFNIGQGAFRRSTLLKRLNAGEYWAVPEELAKWSKITNAAGDKIADGGLIARRKDEAAQWG